MYAFDQIFESFVEPSIWREGVGEWDYLWNLNPVSTGVLLQEQHPKKNSKKSPEDEEVQKIKFLCGVATYFTILPIPACTPDIIVYMGSISRKLVERKKKIFFYLDFKMKKKRSKTFKTPQ